MNVKRSSLSRVQRAAALLVVATLVLGILLWSSLTSVPTARKGNGVAETSRLSRDMVVQRLWLNFGAAYHNATAVAAQGSSDSSHNGFIVVEHASQHVPEDVVRAASRRWKAFMRLAPTFEQHTQAFTRDRAIVISGGGYQLEFVFASVRLLRLYGCTLPIELWVSSVRGEVPSVTQRRALEQIGVEVMDLDAYAGVFPELAEQMHPSKPSTKPYILKQLALVSSNCRQCLLLDADNAAVRDPTYLFSDENFVRTGHLLWPDFWHMRTGPASIRAIFGLNDDWASTSPWDVRTVESGQMVVDKARAWRTLMLSVYMQLQTEFFDNQMRALHHLGGGGDKQTFLIGCLATNSSCHIIDHPVASAARIIDGTFCGRAMVQHDSSGQILFVHANLDKKKFLARVASEDGWTEELRINDVVRQPTNEGSFGVAFTHAPSCKGGEYVVQVNGEYQQVSLKAQVGRDFERERFEYIKVWQQQQQQA